METFTPLTIEQQQDLLMRHADLEVKVAALTHQLDQLYKLIRGSKSERFVPEEWLLNTLRKIPSQPITKILELLP